MDRKKFLLVLSSLPFLNIPFKAAGNTNYPFFTEACKTQKDQEGPFYKEHAQQRNVIETDGISLTIEGKVVKGDDCSTPVANAIVDIWHCDNKGEYDMQGYKCRGYVVTDANGNYSFASIFPPPYDGRPRHIHVKVRAQGYPELTTQIYFQGDANIKNDFAKNAEKTRVIALTDQKHGKKGKFDIYL